MVWAGLGSWRKGGREEGRDDFGLCRFERLVWGFLSSAYWRVVHSDFFWSLPPHWVSSIRILSITFLSSLSLSLIATLGFGLSGVIGGMYMIRFLLFTVVILFSSLSDTR